MMTDWYHMQGNRDGFFSRHPYGVYKVSNEFSKQEVIDEIAQAMNPPLNKSCVNSEIDWTDGSPCWVEEGYWWLGIARGVIPEEIKNNYHLVRLNRKEVG